MEKGLLVSGEWYNCGIWFYLPLKVGRGDVHSRGGLGRRGILSPSSLWQICWLVFEVCDMVQLLFLLSNYKIIYHDIIFCTNRSNHYKTSPLRVRYLQIYQQSHYVKNTLSNSGILQVISHNSGIRKLTCTWPQLLRVCWLPQ